MPLLQTDRSQCKGQGRTLLTAVAMSKLQACTAAVFSHSVVGEMPNAIPAVEAHYDFVNLQA